MAKSFIDDTVFTNIAGSIREKLEVEDTYLPSEMSAAIDSIPVDVEYELKDVNLYDYNGTLLYQYDKYEFMSMDTLPTPPEHNNLTFEGWNWPEIGQIKRQLNEVGGRVDVGALYHTTDGYTHITYHVGPLNKYSVYLYIQASTANDVTIEFGDESSSAYTRLDSTNATTVFYEYTNHIEKDVDITIKANTGTYSFPTYININSESNGVWNKTKHETRYPYLNSMKAVYFSEQVTSLGGNVFDCAINLKEISMPSSIESIGNRTFLRCSKLKGLVIPTNVTTLGDYLCEYDANLRAICVSPEITSINKEAFKECRRLKNLTIPYKVTSLGQFALENDISLQKLFVPSSVTTVNKSFANACTGVNEVEIKSTANPTAGTCYAWLSSSYELEIPEGMTTIGTSAFSSYTLVEKLTIPHTVTSIASKAFENFLCCKGYYILNTDSMVSLANVDGLTINSDTYVYVPNDLLDSYLGDEVWSSLTDGTRNADGNSPSDIIKSLNEAIPDYLCFEAIGGSSPSLYIECNYEVPSIEELPVIEYCFYPEEDGWNWLTVTWDGPYTEDDVTYYKSNEILFHSGYYDGQTCYFRAATNHELKSDEEHYLTFKTINTNPENGSGFLVRGSIQSMVDYETMWEPVLSAHGTAHLFEGADIFTTPKLPAVELNEYCYYRLFADCKYITEAPKVLPATSAADFCYAGMFSGCERLKTSPRIILSDLYYSCCEEMFNGCESLNSITCLAGLNENEGTPSISTMGWTAGVSNNGTFFRIADTTAWNNPATGYSGIPEGWEEVIINE